MITIDYVLTAEDDYEFKPEVKALAANLKKLNDAANDVSADISAQLFKLFCQLDLDAEDLKAAVGPHADQSDQIEAFTQEIINRIANRNEAYINPPPGVATTAEIKAGEPTEQ